LTAVALSWASGLSGPPIVAAQQSRLQRPERAARARNEYTQVETLYSRIAEVLNEREARGWETFQIVPVSPTNLGVGGSMRVAIIFRRPAQ
jgi:hypothetical protein